MSTQTKRDWFYWYDKLDVPALVILSFLWGYNNEILSAKYWLGMLALLVIFTIGVFVTQFIHTCQKLDCPIGWAFKVAVWKPWSVVTHVDGITGYRDFWKKSSADSWRASMDGAYDHISPVMLRVERNEYMDWFMGLIWPTDREYGQ